MSCCIQKCDISCRLYKKSGALLRVMHYFIRKIIMPERHGSVIQRWPIKQVPQSRTWPFSTPIYCNPVRPNILQLLRQVSSLYRHRIGAMSNDPSPTIGAKKNAIPFKQQRWSVKSKQIVACSSCRFFRGLLSERGRGDGNRRKNPLNNKQQSPSSRSSSFEQTLAARGDENPPAGGSISDNTSRSNIVHSILRGVKIRRSDCC
jgi:hypothetical protein